MIGRYSDIKIAGLAMKKPVNVEDLAAGLTAAASAPLVRPPQEPASKVKPGRPKGEPTVAVYLRVPNGIYARYDAEAVTRTKATGKGVTVQQVILEKLDGSL
jgi:hypothetical protein